MSNLCHLTALFHHIITGIAQTIYIGNQPFKSVPAMQINIVICKWEKFPFYCIGDTLRCCAKHTSRKYPVQIFSILIDKAHGTMLKPAWIHQMDDDHLSVDLIRLQVMR